MFYFAHAFMFYKPLSSYRHKLHNEKLNAFILHHILLGQSNDGSWDGWVMYHARERCKIHI